MGGFDGDVGRTITVHIISLNVYINADTICEEQSKCVREYIGTEGISDCMKKTMSQMKLVEMIEM